MGLLRTLAKALRLWSWGGVACDLVIINGEPVSYLMSLQRELLALLSGRRQQVISAVAVVDGDGKLRSRLSISTLTFKRLTAAEIDAYVACGEGLGKAGGYAIQGRAAAYTRALSGSYSGVVGLPLFETAALLRASGVDVA